MMRKAALSLATAAAIAFSIPAVADEPIRTIVVRQDLTMLRNLLARAKQDMEAGDISAARARLKPAVLLDMPDALRLMGQTYDPRWLMAHGVMMPFDDVKAAQFYLAASKLGD